MDPNAHKKGLRNKLSKEQALNKLESENFFRKTLSFYSYVIIDNPEKFRDKIFKDWSDLDCLGRIYVAREGINAQMNVPEHNWGKFITSLNQYKEFKKIPLKIAVGEHVHLAVRIGFVGQDADQARGEEADGTHLISPKF